MYGEEAPAAVTKSGLSSLGVPWHTQILADQLTLFQPGGTDYAQLIKEFCNRGRGLSAAI